MKRRQFLALSGCVCLSSTSFAETKRVKPLIESIKKETLWTNRDGKTRTWFHPRACMFPDQNGNPIALMNLQEIGGSNYFGPVHWTVSKDLGRTWSEPEPIASLGRDPVSGRKDNLMAGVCDVTPQYHPQTNTVIALGHVVFYKGDYFARKEQLARYPVYAVRAADGTWSQRKVLKWDDPRGGHIYSNNCGQRVVRPDGSVQMSFTFGPEENNRMVAGVRASFDGSELRVQQVDPPLHNPKGRGLLEPSVTEFANQFWITIRAEDNRMSTTQQHWLTHSEGLFLVYTRKDQSNSNVIRWRSSLWVAQVDPIIRRLIRETEQIVLPLVGDGVNQLACLCGDYLRIRCKTGFNQLARGTRIWSAFMRSRQWIPKLRNWILFGPHSIKPVFRL